MALELDVHGVDAAGYQSFLDTWKARGYVPVLVSAAGPQGRAVFAGGRHLSPEELLAHFRF